jgi:hypothetical protein
MITDNFISIVWPSSVACHLGLRRASTREGTSTGHVGGSADA